MSHVYIIAEAGVNHNGSIELAKELVDIAKSSGADCVKFQTFKSENLVSNAAQKAEYQIRATGDTSQKDMLKKLELSYDEFLELKNYCDKVGICFLSTPFDFDSIAFLNMIDMPFWKIPSGEVTNFPYLIALAKTGKPIIMSTGMCEMDEIEMAVHVLQENGAGDIKLLHCNTEYPTPFEDVNLSAMIEMQKKFNVEIGYSDHTEGIEVAIAAVALGATVIEKHFTLSREMEGPDHKASIEPDGLAAMVSGIRNIEKAIGDGKKKVSASEKKNKIIVRKSIVAGRKIKKGEIFTEENITVKRPGKGISPIHWNKVLGSKAVRDFEKDELIEQ
ncbi:N-acetylneuraminate synthase [bacterium D16-51]|nr:N-acetylneuraminate synthase [bacterium D16-59]RKI55887.1 N-acetylneuraminate synthase [bacterium D16-51]